MKKPQNFFKINHQKFDYLGINWEIQLSNLDDTDLTNKIFLIHYQDGTLGRCFMIDISWVSQTMHVYVPKLGEGAVGPFIKQHKFANKEVRTVSDFINSMKMIIIDIIDNFDIHKDIVEAGQTPLSQLVKSDNSDTNYSVDYINKTWSCTCKAFVYSKTQPQTCKHINKVRG